MSKLVFRKILMIIVVFVVFIFSYNLSSYAVTFDHFNLLKKKLVIDGFDSVFVDQIYSDSKVVFDGKKVAGYFLHNESNLNYKQFVDKNSIDSIKEYIKIYNKELFKAENDYEVDKEIITAILFIESRLGLYLGTQKVINILSSMAAISGKKTKNVVREYVLNERKISKDTFEVKANRKSKWAYEELKAFLNYTLQQNINPIDIVGSYAGAVGIAQFMPSNLILFAKDGNGNGKIDLFEHSDAIISVANYLKYYGWRANISFEEAKKVLLFYNNSKYYVDTIIEIYNLLKS